LGVLLVAAWVWGWYRTGHADGFEGTVRDNFLSPISKWIAKEFEIDREGRVYNFLFWTIKGFIINIMLPLVIHHTEYINASLFLTILYMIVGTLSFPIGYWLAYRISEHIDEDSPLHPFSGIVLGELLSGAGVGYALSILI